MTYINRALLVYLTSLSLLLLSREASGQSNIYFLNKTGREIHIQKRTILEAGSFPYTLDTLAGKYQHIPLQTNTPIILNMYAVPPKGPYGTADGIYYLLKAKDTLVATLDKNNKLVLAHISNPGRTEELSFFLRHTASVGMPLPYRANSAFLRRIWGSTTDLRSRDRLLDSLYQPYINSAESFCAANKLDISIGKFYRYFYTGFKIADKLFADRGINNELKESLRTFYKDSLIKWVQEFNCTDCNNIPFYNYALRQMFALRFLHTPEQAFLDSVAALTKGSNKSFLLSRYMVDRIELTRNTELLLKKYDALCNDSLYTNIVHRNYQLQRDRSRVDSNELAILMKADKSEIGFNRLMTRLKGKVVYVDFWASWCKPCVQEIPYSHTLNKKVKDKDIVMMYISIDTDFNSWLEARSRHKVDTEYSFILANPANSGLSKKIQLGPIPRYIVFDKNGKIVRFDADRPSDPGIYNTLLDILKQ
ncbi:MAG: TlpA family protein disulfide reductase [Niastella sp.]|nr:TlpA family protein disulfide reductase [Niastella sp.]